MRTLRFITCLVLLTGLQQAFAARLSAEISYYPSDFYRHVENGERDAALKAELFKILSLIHVQSNGANDRLATSCANPKACVKHISLGYTAARRLLFGNLHLVESTPGAYAIRDVYCQKTVTKRDFTSRPPGPGQIPDPAVLNAEHTWPQSKFSAKFDRTLQKSDLHILFPVLSNANSSRNNNEFGDVVTPLSSPCKESVRGYTARGGSQVFFEVPDQHKGNVARAIFYFSTRYNLPVGSLQEDSLRAWHRLDPVDDAERTRNATIFSNQFDRNPFIDHPELVELISDF